MSVRKIPKVLGTLTVPMPEPGLPETAQRMLLQAETLAVTCSEDYETAAGILQALTAREKEVELQRKGLKKPLDELVARIQELFRPPLTVLARAKEIVKQKMGAFAQEQERIRREAQRRADLEARVTREKLEAQAVKAANAGRLERAAVLQQRAEAVAVPAIESETPKVSGITLREHWLFEVTNEALVPREYLRVDEAALHKAVAEKKDAARIAGVRVWSELRPAQRS